MKFIENKAKIGFLIILSVYFAINLASIFDLLEILLVSTAIVNLIVLSYILVIITNAILALILLLTICFISICIFISQQIEFMSLLLLIVYVGSLAIIFLFVIMLFDSKAINENTKTNSYQNFMWLLVGIIFVFKIVYFSLQIISYEVFFRTKQQTFVFDYSSSQIKLVSQLLYESEFILFIILSFVLLAALIGSVVLAKNRLNHIGKALTFCFIPYMISIESWFLASAKFFNTWPQRQWIFSLILMALFYWLTSVIYNRLAIYINQKFNWKFYVFNNKTRLKLFFFDLLINYLVGTFLMIPEFSNNEMAQFLLKCPIGLSPFIMVFELFLMVLYSIYRWIKSYLNK
jgi:NADH-quinone oxidoreductase subunit J